MKDRPVDPEDVMPGMLDRIKQFARSPQGRRTAEQVRRAAADPRRRAQAQEMLRKFGKRR
jgi:GTP cyclohydrolase II